MTRNSDATAPADLPADPTRAGDRARRDPFGIGTPRQPGWDVLGVVPGGFDPVVHGDPSTSPQGVVDEVVEVRRNGVVSGVVGSLAAGVAVAWFSRAAAGGTWLDWTVTAVLGVLAVLHLSAFVDGRVPLAVIDQHGVRLRFGRTWQGLPWPSIDHVVHRPRTGLFRDGRLVVEPFEADDVVAALDGRARRQAWVTRLLHGGAFALPLGLSTRVVGAPDLTEALLRLADDDVEIVVPEPVAAVAEVVEPDTEAGTEAGIEDEPEVRPVVRSDLADPAPEVGDVPPTQPVAAYTVARDLPVLTSVGRWDEERDRDERPATTPTYDEQPLDEVPDETGDEGVDERDDERDDEASGSRPEVRRVAPWAAALIARVAEYRRRGREREDDSVVAWSEEGATAGHDDRADDGWDDGWDDDRSDAEATGPIAVVPAVRASATPLPLRDLRGAARSEHEAEERLPEASELRRSGEPELPTYTFDELATLAGPADDGTPAVEPVEPVEPVIGPELTAARARLGLSVDQVAERTRIRPHVIEAIEVDDFGPCGGDFYARGHLRTLTRVLGVDSAELLAAYDERYADAPIDARRVFEAELAGATGGGLRATRGGPNWSVLVAAVMSLVLLWSVAQLLFEGDREVESTSGAAGLSSGTAAAAVGLELQAGEVDASLTVRDGDGAVVWQGDLAAGETHSVEAVPPLRISSTDGSVTARVSGGEVAALGEAGTAVQRTLVP